MSRRFFTADWHLNSEGVRVTGHRPFKSVDTMNRTIIANANAAAKSRSDVIVHVGDFVQSKDDGHYGDIGKVENRIRPDDFVGMLNATFVNIEGNHDASNKVRSVGRSLMTKLGEFYDVSIGHYPSFCKEARGTFISYARRSVWTVRLCGHAHDKWKWMFDLENKILNVNVGVDVWNYRIVSENDILGFIGSLKSKIDKKLAEGY